MDRKSRVPQFGNWDNGETALYTAYFDKARQNRHGGKMINPNDPEENPDAFLKNSSSGRSVASSKNTVPVEPNGQRVVRPTHGRRASKEDGGNLRQMNNYPAPATEYKGRRLDNDSTEPRNADRIAGPGEAHKRAIRRSAGSEHSIERSPLHRPNQATVAGRGSKSPSWGGNGSIDGPRGAPGRSHMRPNAGSNGSGGRGASVPVPRFGDWDVNSAASSDGYTFIFSKVREEKQSVSVKTPERFNQPSYANERRMDTSHGNYKSKNSCFPWCGF